MEIVNVATPAHLADARRLIEEYIAWLTGEQGIDLSYQDYQDELADLPGRYAPPQGRLVVVYDGDTAIGCGAFKPLGDGTVELKRMFVQPARQGKGVGRRLTEHLLSEARASGATAVRLETGTFMPAAQAVYRSLGFRAIEPYYDVPEEIRAVAIYMELPLD